MHFLFYIKKLYYKYILSTHRCKINDVIPTLLIGDGSIYIANTAQFGYFPSAHYFNGYNHIEAKFPSSIVKIGNKSIVNNNCNIVANETSIVIGERCLIGINFNCFDSDFHSLNPLDRNNNMVSLPVTIGDNVFIGSNVTILKGVKIGSGSTIGSNSVVTKSFPENSVIAGNPAKLIRVYV